MQSNERDAQLSENFSCQRDDFREEGDEGHRLLGTGTPEPSEGRP